jgi:uncharacterized repeat protein (TIGR01451 family)
MKKLLKGKLATVIIIIATFVLAGIAIFTAIRLYQLRSQSVAPNVPSSRPKAQTTCTQEAKICPDGSSVGRTGPNCEFAPCPNACTLSFTLTATSSAVVCTSKNAYKDVASNSPGSYSYAVTDLLAPSASVSAGQKIVYAIVPGPANTTKSITVTDTLPTGVTFIDSIAACTYTDATRKVSCTLASTNTKAAFRVSIKSGVSEAITNTALVQSEGDAVSSCSVSLNPPGVSETPAATPGPSATPNSCNGTCGSNFNCASNLVCYNGFCRNPSCTSAANCACSGTPGPTGTAAPSLPQSGTDWPTILGVWFGAAVILGSLLLAL